MPLRKNTSAWRAEGGRQQETRQAGGPAPASLQPCLPRRAMNLVLASAKLINEVCMVKQR